MQQAAEESRKLCSKPGKVCSPGFHIMLVCSLTTTAFLAEGFRLLGSQLAVLQQYCVASEMMPWPSKPAPCARACWQTIWSLCTVRSALSK